ncbi:MAG: NnrU family protein [Pseudomonadota bacterium]
MIEMSAARWLVVFWVLFGGTHLILSSVKIRTLIIDKIGPPGFQGLYSLIALATFVPLVWIYWENRHGSRMLGDFLLHMPGTRVFAMILGFIGFTLIIASFFQPSPVGMVPGQAQAKGLLRITRHPLFMFMALWAFSHMLVNIYMTDWVFFGGIAAFSIIGAMHQDHRKRILEQEKLGQFMNETSLIPFYAIVAGRNRMVWGELPWVGIVVGGIASGFLYWLHPRLFY